MRSFEQVFGDQESEKTPVNKGQNDFSPEKSPTSFGEEPKILQPPLFTAIRLDFDLSSYEF
jgi:hypothetical protein